MKRITWIIILVGLAIAVATPQVWAQNDRTRGSTCDPAGSWVGTSPPLPPFYKLPTLGTQTITPIDPTGKRFTIVVQPTTGDSTFVGLFPDADQIRDSVGILVRTGPRTFRSTTTMYFVKSQTPGSIERSQVIYFWTSSGTIECVGDTLVGTGMMKVYSNVDRPGLIVPPLGIFGVHDQDKDDDGFADPGEVPFFSAPFGGPMKRLPLMEP